VGNAALVDYGSDISTFVGTGGLDPDFRIISGPRVVAESVARLWLTPRGSLITDPDAGVDLRELLGAEIDDAVLANWRAKLVIEAKRDPRVKTCSVDLTYDRQLEKVTVRATLGLVTEDDDGNVVVFPFVLKVGQLEPEFILPEAA